MKIIIIFTFLFFLPQHLNAGSFSEVFGSEGSSGIENPKSRSLSYSLQYLGFTGAIGYTIKQLHDTGFFTPFGFEPDYRKKLSPLAYDKSKIFNTENSILKMNKSSVEKINDIIDFRGSILKNGIDSNIAQNQSEFYLNDSIYRKNSRDFLINRYFKDE
ncbi:MAG: hypothetical protein CMM91_10455 [Rickettsiales bacterium]|nr:hypothetical protein [Rickettsiales bacterium]OUV52894.1 MAG: hypothetical protein CBC87_05940 [Rickettsiales bacterium TMED127]|tara:strand:- start:34343 stop:34819 length:477 start_codon:yes stop_codon:yes gene_type:complete